MGKINLTWYTVDDLLEELPIEKLSKPKLERLLEEHGTYREIDGKKFLTEQDVRDFLAAISARKRPAAQPPPNEVGWMVFIGHPWNDDYLVFVDWCPLGQEQVLAQRIADCAPNPVMLLSKVNATPRDVELFRQAHSTSEDGWAHGKWYSRSPVNGRYPKFVWSWKALTGEDEEEGIDGAKPIAKRLS